MNRLSEQLGKPLTIELSLSLGTAPGLSEDVEESRSTKAEAHYRRANDGSKQCGSCTHYITNSDPSTPGKCSLVIGNIDPNWVCDYFDRAGRGERDPEVPSEASGSD